MNVREAAKQLEVHENTIRRWARFGILTDVRVPGTSFLRLDDQEVERLRLERATPWQAQETVSDADMWWAGGLFVGEGSVFVQNKKDGSRELRLSLLMTDRRTVERFRDIITPLVQRRRRYNKAYTLNGFTPKRPNSKPVYQVTLSGLPAESVCRALHPYIRNTDKEDQMIRHFKTLGLDPL